MASIETLLGKDGNPRAYKVAWRSEEGREVTKTLRLKRDAERLKRQMEDARDLGALIDVADRGVTLGAYVTRWTEAQTHRSGTAERAGRVLAHLTKTIGADRRVVSIGRTDIQGWVRRRAQQIAPSTLITEWVWTRALFAAAVADRIRPDSPCATVALPQAAPRARVEIPSYAALCAVTDAMLSPVFVAMVWVGARTGLRPGELRGLTIGQVDFFRHTLTVDRQAARSGAIVAVDRVTGKLGPVPPKTEKSHRTIPIDPETTGIIAAHLAAHPAGDDGLIFTNRSGRAYSGNAMADNYKRAGRRVGVPFHPHATRHFYASVLIAEGRNPIEVKERLGHAKLAETMDTYGHLFPGADDGTRGAIAGFFERAASEPRPLRGLLGSKQASDQGF
jgi:integrase